MTLADIKRRLAALVASFKEQARDGLTFFEIVAFLKEVLGALMSVVAEWNAPGFDKKKLVIEAISEVIDVALASLSFPGVPFYVVWLLKAALPLVKTYLLNQVDVWLEQKYLADYKLAA